MMNFTSRLLMSILTLGALALGASAHAQTFTFTTTNTSTGTSQGTGSGPNTITGTGSGAANLFFTNTPDGTSSALNTPTNIVPFRIVPTFIAPTTQPPVGTVLTSNFNDTFNLTLTITANGGTGTATFTGINFAGPMSATFLGAGVPNTIAGYSFNDNVSFTLPAADLVPQLVTAGGTQFQVSLVSFTNPGNPNGSTPEGNIGGRIVAVPEPGSVAMLMGMGLTGAGFLARKRRK